MDGGRRWTRTSGLLHVKRFRLSAVLRAWEAERKCLSYTVTRGGDRSTASPGKRGVPSRGSVRRESSHHRAGEVTRSCHSDQLPDRSHGRAGIDGSLARAALNCRTTASFPGTDLGPLRSPQCPRCMFLPRSSAFWRTVSRMLRPTSWPQRISPPRHSGPVASGQASSHYAAYSALASIRSFRVVDIALKLPLGYPHDERLS